MMNRKQFVRQIDPGLRYVDDLAHADTGVIVYKVAEGRHPYVLKAGRVDNYLARTSVMRERKALRAARGLHYVTQIERDYCLHGQHVALLKTYFEGLDLLRLGLNPGHSFWSTVSDAVASLHRTGIADIDLKPFNLIVSPDRERKVIGNIADLDKCVMRDEVSFAVFEESKQRDLSDLKWLENQYGRLPMLSAVGNSTRHGHDS